MGQKGPSKDHRPDLNQMVVGVMIDSTGKPVCCEMWPGNMADVNSLIPVTHRIRSRFHPGQFCIVADRGMISADTVKQLHHRAVPYVLGTRMRKVNEIKRDVLSRSERYREVHPEKHSSKDPAPLRVKEVVPNGTRYIVCLNPRQARKDAQDRQAIIESLQEKIKTNRKALIGNKGYRKYLTMGRDSVRIDKDKINDDSRFDGKWVLITNTELSAEQVALKYKQLWQVEQVFRDVKSILETRPVYHQRDDNIRGHVFCSFLSLVLKKELDRRLEEGGHDFEWGDIKQDLKALEEVVIEDNEDHWRSEHNVLVPAARSFRLLELLSPPTIREV